MLRLIIQYISAEHVYKNIMENTIIQSTWQFRLLIAFVAITVTVLERILLLDDKVIKSTKQRAVLEWRL